MTSLFLRIALAFSFLYPAYRFWQSPDDWVGYLPPFLKNAGIPEATILTLLAVFHIALALWLLSGWRIFLPSLVAAFFLAGVVFFNWNQIDILFRDLSLALAALALAFASRDS